jgi:putative glutamine amidotransferase
MAVAHSPDGIIEAAEWSVKEAMPFLLLVQWHPERVKNPESTLSNNLARIFLREVSLSIANKITS